MDAILDLTSRAVSLITLMQDSLLRLKRDVNYADENQSNIALFADFLEYRHEIISLCYFKEQGTRISWISITPSSNEAAGAEYTYQRCTDLIAWINSGNNLAVFRESFSGVRYFPAPEQWRKAIRKVLYVFKEERILLANSLQYLPIQIALTAPGVSKMNATNQRLLQIWNISENKDLNAILCPKDVKLYDVLAPYRSLLENTASEFILDDSKLTARLKDNKVPLSFLQIFNSELEEIHAARHCRRDEIIKSDRLFTLTDSHPQLVNEGSKEGEDNKEHFTRGSFEKIFQHAFGNDAGGEDIPATKAKCISEPDYTESQDLDPLIRAENMNLWALAFSGGGIRSATFNLGVLQGFAKKGLLSKFDYLSTVSGGGYIGSWLVSWIARNKSVSKVSDRLDPTQSSDPFADEVRPIRWLRMYSNYLAPQAGIMSADAWTMGMTLLRNMLINQLVILSLLLSLIAGGRLVFLLWTQLAASTVVENPIISFNLISGILLIVSAVMAGFGMQAYHKEKFPPLKVSPRIKNQSTHFLIWIGCIVALALSIWLYRHAQHYPNNNAPDFKNFEATYIYFIPTMITGFLSMLVVAVLGRYDRCFKSTGLLHVWEIFVGILLSAVAVAAGGALLALLAKFSVYLAGWKGELDGVRGLSEKLSFIFLPPLVIEVISITIVLRMAFLGINFPDERREWWGRIGGMIHRVCLIWVGLFGITMIGGGLIALIPGNIESIDKFLTAGWGATLIAGLFSAYSGSTSGKESKGGLAGIIKEYLALIAPYLFLIGVMTLLPPLYHIIELKLGGYITAEVPLLSVLIFVALCAITIMLAHHIGVNQFSMHLFYKNRLVRAFLGATRIRLERQRSANPFTGFDTKDDLLLAELKVDNAYFGPYPIINAAMNSSSDTVLDRQDRKAESFIFSPNFCGFDFSRTRAAANVISKTYDYGYRPTNQYGYQHGPHLGTAMAISGAAASPNMGYHTSAATSFLLSVFNIRLGWWIGNPRMSKWTKADPTFGLGYLISDMTGNADTSKDFVCLSDGGHFDNMGIYELIRRRCRYIILSDGEQDEALVCEGLANAIRRCRIDFGVEIRFKDIENITTFDQDNFSKKNYAVGTITYPESEKQNGILIYIKASMTSNESVDLQEFRKKNSTFPHQTTGDQFFDESQFESYRKLGLNIIDKLIP